MPPLNPAESEISRVRVRLPLLWVAAKLLPSMGSMTDCLRQGGLPQSIVADFSIGIDHKVRYYGLWHPSKRALQMAARAADLPKTDGKRDATVDKRNHPA